MNKESNTVIQSKKEVDQNTKSKEATVFWNEMLQEKTPFRFPKWGSGALSNQESKLGRYSRILPQELNDSIRSFCTEHIVSVQALMTTLVSLYLSRAYAEESVPLLISSDTLDIEFPIFYSVKKGNTFFSQLVYSQNVEKNAVACLPFPLEDLVSVDRFKELLAIEEMPRCRYILQSSINEPVQHNGLNNSISQIKDTKSPPLTIPPLTVEWHDFARASKFEWVLHYRLGNFSAYEAELITERLLILLRTILVNPEVIIETLPLLCSEDKRNLACWNQTGLAFPIDTTLHQLFESQVEKTPERIAVSFGEQDVSYRLLNRKANRLAHEITRVYRNLFNREIEADTVFALYFERSIDMLVSLLAVLKSGAAFLPISADFPSERILYMLKDSNCPLVLTHSLCENTLTSILQAVSSSCPQVIVADHPNDSDSIIHSGESNLNSKATADSLAYLLYTSGTTGSPKGVEISHRASCSRNRYMAERGRCDKNRYLFKTNYIFDVSISDIFSHFFVGARIVVTQSSFDPEEIARLIRHQKVNAAHFVPSQYSALAHSGYTDLALEQVYFSGENLGRDVITQLDIQFSRVINYYGPTETGEVSSHIVTSENDGGNIGTLFDGARAYVALDDLSLAPIGVPGELFIAGPGIARGYLNKPDLTRTSFLDNLFETEENIKTQFPIVYRTGDRVRWSCEGHLIYEGRKDRQVKIRGIRIELKEIEAHLLAFKPIQHALVLDIKRGNTVFLAAYIVLNRELYKESGNNSTSNERLFNRIRIDLSKILPEFMIPTTFSLIEYIPMTANGKLDRSGLPEIDFSQIASFTAPETELEKRLCLLWETLLTHEPIGMHDTFFRLGGDSYTLAILRNRIIDKWGLDIGFNALMNANTVSLQAALIEQKINRRQAGIEEKINIIPITNNEVEAHPLQQWQWMETDRGRILRPVFLQVSFDVQFDEEAFQKTLRRLVQRHSVLRTVLSVKEGRLVQSIEPKYCPTLSITYRDLLGEKLSAETAFENAQHIDRVFYGKCLHELKQPPYLISICISEKSSFDVMISFDHSIVDGYSLDILQKELLALYHGYSSAHEVNITPLKYDYCDLSAWLNKEYRLSDQYKYDRDFWLSYSNRYRAARLPFDHASAKPFENLEGQCIEKAAIVRGLSKTLSAHIKRTALENGLTLSNTLCGVASLMLQRVMGVDYPSIGYNLSGRTFWGAEQLVGSLACHHFIATIAQKNALLVDVAKRIQEDMNDIATHIHYEHHALLPLGISSGDFREKQKEPSSSVIFSYDPYEEIPDSELPVIESEKSTAMSCPSDEHSFFIWLKFYKKGDRLVLWVQYDPSYYLKSTMDRIIKHLLQIMSEGLVTTSQAMALEATVES